LLHRHLFYCSASAQLQESPAGNFMGGHMVIHHDIMPVEILQLGNTSWLAATTLSCEISDDARNILCSIYFILFYFNLHV